MEARITRERDETKALIGEIAHQMRNPLAGVESYTQLLEGEISGEPGRTYLRALEQSEQRLHFLTESFIKMARLEQQMIQIKKQPMLWRIRYFQRYFWYRKRQKKSRWKWK